VLLCVACVSMSVCTCDCVRVICVCVCVTCVWDMCVRRVCARVISVSCLFVVRAYVRVCVCVCEPVSVEISHSVGFKPCMQSIEPVSTLFIIRQDPLHRLTTMPPRDRRLIHTSKRTKIFGFVPAVSIMSFHIRFWRKVPANIRK